MMRMATGFMAGVLVLCTLPIAAPAQDNDRRDTLLAASTWVLDHLEGEYDPDLRHDLVLDQRRTAEGEEARGRLVSELVEALEARRGVIEEHCVHTPVDPHPRVISSIRDASAVIAPQIEELDTDTAVVSVAVWWQEGMHSGSVRYVPLKKVDGEWVLDRDRRRRITMIGCPTS